MLRFEVNMSILYIYIYTHFIVLLLQTIVWWWYIFSHDSCTPGNIFWHL